MFVTRIASMVSTCRAIANVFNTYERYRDAMERVIASDHLAKRLQSIRRLAELRDEYVAAMEAARLEANRGWDSLAYYRYLILIQKTVAGLVQQISQHVARKLRSALRSVCLASRVRQITVTHPSIAPPEFA